MDKFNFVVVVNFDCIRAWSFPFRRLVDAVDFIKHEIECDAKNGCDCSYTIKAVRHG